MKSFKSVIQSETAPNTSSLWLNNKKLWFFEDGWKPIGGDSDNASSKDIEEINRFLIGNGSYSSLSDDYPDDPIDYIQRLVNNKAPLLFRPDRNTEELGLYGAILNKLQLDSNYPSLSDTITFSLEAGQEAIEHNCSVLDYMHRYIYRPDDDIILPVYVYSYNTCRCIPAIYHNKNGDLYIDLGSEYFHARVIKDGDNKGTIEEVSTTAFTDPVILGVGDYEEVLKWNKDHINDRYTGSYSCYVVNEGYGMIDLEHNVANGGFADITVLSISGIKYYRLNTTTGHVFEVPSIPEDPSRYIYYIGDMTFNYIPTTITITDSIQKAKINTATTLVADMYKLGSVPMYLNSISAGNDITMKEYLSPVVLDSNSENICKIRATVTISSDKTELAIDKDNIE